jgi:predicted transposase YbfD/YdcC
MVSAFAARQRLVLGQVKVNEKSNEIVAIPALLDMLAIEGAVITIDAMGCQRAIAKQIKDKKADYIRERFCRTSRSSQASRKPMDSGIRKSADTRLSMAIMAAWKRETIQ